MTRHWIVTDADGSNTRSVTMAEYATALERGDRIKLAGMIARQFPRPETEARARTLAEHAQALGNV